MPHREARTTDKRHGRLEIRVLRVVTNLCSSRRWAGLKHAFRIIRHRHLKGKPTSEEIAFGITSLPPEAINAASLMALLRSHWRIENCLHYVRDVTMGEDRCRVTRGHTPQLLAALRNCSLHLIDRQGDPKA